MKSTRYAGFVSPEWGPQIGCSASVRHQGWSPPGLPRFSLGPDWRSARSAVRTGISQDQGLRHTAVLSAGAER